MTRRPRILLAALFHETHSFVDEITTLDDYTIRGVLDRRGDGSTVDGFLEVADDEGWDVVSAADFTALPSGTTDHAVFELFWEKLHSTLTAALADGGLDGIWLALHGAMVTTESVDPEGELLSRIRAVQGAEHLPLFGVFDLHANFTPAMAHHANGLIAYRENPHIDARESAIRSARLMARALNEKTLPHMVTLTAPLMWPPTGTGTADRPMRDLEALARRIEAETPAIWAVNVVAGYSFSDTPDTGVSFAVITTADDSVAQSALQHLCDLAIELRELGLPEEWNLDAAVAHVKTLSGGPHVIVEPSDNIGGGAPGDGTAVLRAFLAHDLDNAAVAIADPAAVAALTDAVPGQTRRLSLGGKGSAIADPPIEIDAVFVSRSDGNFTLEDRNSHLAASQGVHFAMGPSAVVTVGRGITVLITSRKTPPFDLAQFRSQGINPEDLKAIGVKAAVAHRRAYDPIAAGSYTVETAGPCTSKITTLPFRRLRPGVFPIHPDRSPE